MAMQYPPTEQNQHCQPELIVFPLLLKYFSFYIFAIAIEIAQMQKEMRVR